MCLDCDLISGLWSAIKDLVPFVGLLIAGLGLSTWRKQLRVTTRHEAAFKTLRSAIEARNALRDVRRARVYRIAANEAGTSESLLQAKYAEHRRRVDPFHKAMDELQAHELDAAVLFGEKLVRDALEPLYAASTRFTLDFEDFYQRELQRLAGGEPGPRASDQISLLKTIYGEPTDEFGVSVENAFNGIQALLSPKLY